MLLFSPKKAASLLTILLLLAVVGAMVLTGSRALQQSSRTAAAVSQREEAKAAAMSGIMEGIRYITSEPQSEYGTIVNWNLTGFPATTYSNTPLRRGFTSGTTIACSNQSAAEAISTASSTINKNCPYYDLSLRNRAGYDSTNYTKFALNSRDFHSSNPTKIIPFKGNTLSLVVAQGVGIMNVSFCLTSTYGGVCGIGTNQIIAPGGVYSPANPSSYNFIQITVNYTSYPANPTAIITMNNPGQQVVIGKGYTTVDVTGYAGETSVKMVYTQRHTTKFLSEVTGGFTTTGIQQ